MITFNGMPFEVTVQLKNGETIVRCDDIVTMKVREVKLQ